MRFQPRFSILAAAALGLMPAAAFGETLTVTGIEITGDSGFRLSVPVIEATDSSFDEADFRALFSADFTSAAGELASLDAASIRIPTLTITYDTPDGSGESQSATITYSDFELTDIADGVAQSASIGKSVMETEGPAVFTMGRMTTGLLDLGGTVGLYGLGGEPQSNEIRPLYEDFHLEGMTLTSDPLTCEIGPASAERFSARPIAGSFDELLAVSAELEAAEASGKAPSPEAIAKIVEFYADFFTAIEATPVIVDGMSCEGHDPDGKAVRLSSGPMTVGGFAPGIYPALGVDDFRMEIVDDGWMEFANFTWKQMDLNGPLDALLDAKDSLTPAWFEANWRKLIPAIEGFALAGFAMDIPDPETQGARLRANIGTLDVALADYVNGIPSEILAKGSGIEVPVPEGADGMQLRAIGVDKLLIDYDLSARWEESTKTIAVDAFSLASANLGGLSLKGTIANAGPELFSADPDVATAAATGLTVTELTIQVENAGLAPLLIAMGAAEESMPPEAFHKALVGLARALPLSTLGGTPDAMQLSDALGEFLEGAPTLTLTLTAIDPAGIGLADLMAAQDNPMLLKDKVTIAAATEGEPVPFTFPEILRPQPAEPESTETPDTAPQQPSMPAPGATRPSTPQGG